MAPHVCVEISSHPFSAVERTLSMLRSGRGHPLPPVRTPARLDLTPYSYEIFHGLPQRDTWVMPMLVN